MIYRYKATIAESKLFMRVYEVKGDMNLFRFNQFIVNDLGFAPDQMVVFEGYGADGAMTGEYGLFDMGDGAIDKVTFEQTVKKEETELHYVFDLHNDRCIKLELLGEGEYVPMRSYPFLSEEKGVAPDQFKKMVEEVIPVAKPLGDDFDDDDDNLDDDDDGDNDNDTEEIYDENEEGED